VKNDTKTKIAEPGLVAWYDIWPGNGTGLFSQGCHTVNYL